MVKPWLRQMIRNIIESGGALKIIFLDYSLKLTPISPEFFLLGSFIIAWRFCAWVKEWSVITSRFHDVKKIGEVGSSNVDEAKQIYKRMDLHAAYWEPCIYLNFDVN